MALEIKVPALGESVTEATVAKWFKTVGEAVAADEPLVELETDKVTVEVNAPAAGTLSQIVANSGETVGVGALLGSIAEGAAPAKAKPATPAAKPAAAPAPVAAAPAVARDPGPAARKALAESGLTAGQIAGTGKDGRVTKADVLQARQQPQPTAPPPAPAPHVPRELAPREER